MRNTILTSVLVFGVSASVLQGGPPLICHPYDIGGAKSLPWGHAHDAMGFDATDPNYNTKQLVADTLTILDAGAPVLVRMETMRRASLYGAHDHGVAGALRDTLRQRASASSPTALALFDFGYFTETLSQLNWLYKEDLSQGVDGYAYVQRALLLESGSAEMHFAAAIMSRSPRRPGYEEHAGKARAATSDALLAANVHSHLN